MLEGAAGHRILAAVSPLLLQLVMIAVIRWIFSDSFRMTLISFIIAVFVMTVMEAVADTVTGLALMTLGDAAVDGFYFRSMLLLYLAFMPSIYLVHHGELLDRYQRWSDIFIRNYMYMLGIEMLLRYCICCVISDGIPLLIADNSQLVVVLALMFKINMEIRIRDRIRIYDNKELYEISLTNILLNLTKASKDLGLGIINHDKALSELYQIRMGDNEIMNAFFLYEHCRMNELGIRLEVSYQLIEYDYMDEEYVYMAFINEVHSMLLRKDELVIRNIFLRIKATGDEANGFELIWSIGLRDYVDFDMDFSEVSKMITGFGYENKIYVEGKQITIKARLIEGRANLLRVAMR